MSQVENISDRARTQPEYQVVIAETDLLCSYFITKRVSEDIKIIGAQEMNLDRLTYIDSDKLFINKGSKDGYKEGDMFSIIAKGKKIANPFTSKKLGTYFLKVSLAEITCIFEDTAVITLRDGCGPVRINDIAIPYKKGKILRKKRIDYRRCVLPRSPVEGRVAYTGLFMEIIRDNPGSESYVTIDIGKAFVSIGDYVLFYKRFKQNLPPLIMGIGVVINPQNTNSTVRVIECSYAVEVGTGALLLPDVEDKRINRGEGEGAPPIIEALEDDSEEVVAEQTLELNIIFNLDEKEIDAEKRSEIEKIKEFTGSTSKYRIILRGYSCSIGGLEYNLKLSQERVENIKNILVSEFGLSEDLIETYYYGEKDAPFDNTSEEQRRKNRVVNIQVMGK
jgi:outer membrane protein OmpA-like peptidoglycan-associated protein